jgi:hypothetical protein
MIEFECAGRAILCTAVRYSIPKLQSFRVGDYAMPGKGNTTGSRNGADQHTRGSNNSGWLDFTESPFGVGNSRLAFRCRVRDGCCHGYTEGSYLVFKVFKPEDTWSAVGSVSYADVSMQQKVRSLAETFNNECHP